MLFSFDSWNAINWVSEKGCINCEITITLFYLIIKFKWTNDKCYDRQWKLSISNERLEWIDEWILWFEMKFQFKKKHTEKERGRERWSSVVYVERHYWLPSQ